MRLCLCFPIRQASIPASDVGDVLSITSTNCKIDNHMERSNLWSYTGVLAFECSVLQRDYQVKGDVILG